MLSVILTFVSLMFMTRYVGEQYGVMMWGWGIVSTFSAVTDLGLGSANIKYVSEGYDKNACFSTFLALKLVLTGVMAGLVVASLLVSSRTDGLSPEMATIIIVFLSYYVLLGLQTTILQTFTGRLENGKVSIVTLVEYVVRTAFLIWLAVSGASAYHLSLAYVAGGVVALLLAIVLLKKIDVRLVRPSLAGTYIRFAAPLAVSVCLIAFVTNFDKVAIGMFKGTMEVGYYAAVAGIMWGFSMLSTSLNAVILPHLAKYDFKKDREPVENLLWRTEKYLFMFLLPVAAIFLVAGPQICSILFGAGFEPSGRMLGGMVGVICFFGYIGLGAQVLFSADEGKLYSKTTIVSMGAALLLFFILIPESLGGVKTFGLGGTGAAVALSVGYAIQAVMISVAVKRVASVSPYPRLWRHAASFLLSLASFALFASRFDIDALPALVLGCVLCLAVYAVSLLMLKELDWGDVRFFKNAFSAKGLYRSLSEEFGEEK